MESAEPRDDEELDRLLSQARWPEPGVEQLARLDRHWRTLQQVRRRRVISGRLALAASVLLVAGFAVWRTLPSALEQPLSVERQPKTIEAPRPMPPVEPPAPRAVVKHEPPQTPPAVAGEVARDPSIYEQVVLLDSLPRQAFQRKPARKMRLAQASLYELIGAGGGGAAATIAPRLASLHVDMARFERSLGDIVRQEGGERRQAAARLLARIATPRSVPLLIELTADPVTHMPAVQGLSRLAGPEALARLAASEPNGELRRQLVEALLARRTYESMGLYLGLVHEPRTRDAALAAITAIDDPPVDLLLDYLESPQSLLRLAAAQAASRIADPAVAERLCESLGGIGRREALIALLLSHSTQAADCLRHARGNIYLVAAVQAAEQQLQTLQIPRGGNLP